MFQQLAGKRTLRASATVPLLEVVSTGTVVDQSAGGLAFVFSTSVHTLGTCNVQARGSVDNVKWFDLDATAGTVIAGNGLDYLICSGALPRYISAQLTPVGGFDGKVQVDVRSTSSFIAS